MSDVNIMSAQEARQISEASDAAMTKYLWKYLEDRIYEQAGAGNMGFDESYHTPSSFWNKYLKVFHSIGMTHISNKLKELGYRCTMARDHIKIYWGY